MIRIPTEAASETYLRRDALSPAPTGRVLRGYPAAWLMAHPTGYWLSTVKPKLEERVSRATWEKILGLSVEDKRVSG